MWAAAMGTGTAPWRRLAAGGLCAAALASAAAAQDGALVLSDAGYYERPGVNVLVFSNWYDSLFSDSKISGVEIIHHGARTATNGDVRLSATPGQWDPIGLLDERVVDPDTDVIEARLSYPDYGFTYVIRAEPQRESLVVTVSADEPLPPALEGRAGFNLEFLPAEYFHKSYLGDEASGTFPLHPASDMTPAGESGRPEPLPLATASRFVLAPEDDARRVAVASRTGELSLYDGRNQAQNGWFVVREMLPSGRTGTLVEWTLTPASTPGWVREPVVSYSQVGYTPDREKIAVIELDKNDEPAAAARVLRVGPEGALEEAFTGPVEVWGEYLRYRYATFDFSTVTEPGVYVIEYEGRRTTSFRIAEDVYADAWHPTLDVFFPVQMDHMFVNEAYRVWHGAAHLDDARQAPVDHEHHDLYRQGPTTDTAFAPGEHIPGLDVGGWFDAGDYDIRTQSQYATVRAMVETWEEFGPTRDQTTVDRARSYVDMHAPDGAPDLLQQIEHGTLQLLAQHKAVGFAIHGIVEPDLDQYTHLGDAVTKTDNLVFDPALAPYEARDGRSGTPDDRWAFTSRSSALNYGSAAALAAASRALSGYNDALAEDALATAIGVWAEERSHEPFTFRHGNTTGGDLDIEELTAAVELLLATGEAQYAERIDALWPQIENRFVLVAPDLVRVLPLMPEDFRARMEAATRALVQQADELTADNPFGVPITRGGWAGSGTVVSYAETTYALHKAFPDIVDAAGVFRSMDYLFGRHPGSNLSLVSGVGTRSKEVAYGANRADFSFIAGGVVPGVLILNPDFPENLESWPFMWGENEYVITVAARYIHLVNAAHALAAGTAG